ncbi:MAG TPA: SMP-30/gluconolactonase/LRE family protein [Acidimicrobiales bacterium]|nr:SMP-30/gluconolactonase/LRE family protein [Acidimicrobiales bacterium]
MQEVATGLRFPEGPIAMADGSVLLVEVERGTLSRATADGTVSVVATLGGGPNGAAIGPDGAVYVCNNGGFQWSERAGMLIPVDMATGATEPPDFAGGWIERVDIDTGKAERLYTHVDGHRLSGPNDLVFDREGGFWFTDFGKTRARDVDRGGLYYAQADGSGLTEVAYGLWGPNGVGLSPAEDRVYVAESFSGRVMAWDLDGPGRVRHQRGVCVAATKGHFDSLAVEAGGAVVVAAISQGLCVVDPDGSHDYVPLPDPMTTNVCFAAHDPRKAFATLSGTGRLVAIDWPRPGLDLAFSA